MEIFLKKLNYYFLSCNNPSRLEHMYAEFNGFNLKEINPITTNTGISKIQSGITGFCRMLDVASDEQVTNKPFQPFVLFEDDVKKYRQFPESIIIPDDADLIYFGLSSWGMTDDKQGSPGTVCFTQVENYPELIKVYNMLSTHGFMVCSLKGLISLQKCLLEDYYKNRGYDMTLAQIQPHINAYAFRIPLVYQYGLVGGQEVATKFEISAKEDKPIPANWINTKSLSYLTNSVSYKNK